MKPGNRRKHGANSCGDISMFLRDERGERLFFEQTTFSLDRKGLFIFGNVDNLIKGVILHAN